MLRHIVETDPKKSTQDGGHGWEVAVPEVSERAEVRTARKDYDKHAAKRNAKA